MQNRRFARHYRVLLSKAAWRSTPNPSDIQKGGHRLTTEEVAVALDGHQHEILCLERRLEAVEKDQEALNRIATSVAVMAEQQKNISHKVNTIDAKVSTLEARPGRRWDGLVDKLLYGLAGACLLWLLAGAPGAGV